VNGTLQQARFNSPSAVCGDGKGNLYVADTFNNCIRHVRIDAANPSNNKVATLAGSGRNKTDDGKGVAASFSRPVDILYRERDDVLFVMCRTSIRRVDISDATVTTVLSHTTDHIGLPDVYTLAGMTFSNSSTDELIVCDTTFSRIYSVNMADKTVVVSVLYEEPQLRPVSICCHNGGYIVGLMDVPRVYFVEEPEPLGHPPSSLLYIRQLDDKTMYTKAIAPWLFSSVYGVVAHGNVIVCNVNGMFANEEHENFTMAMIFDDESGLCMTKETTLLTDANELDVRVRRMHVTKAGELYVADATDHNLLRIALPALPWCICAPAIVSYIDESARPTATHERLLHMARNGKGCDVEVVCGEKSFMAHKVILMATCDYFCKMFDSAYAESSVLQGGRHIVKVEGVKFPGTIGVLFTWLYTHVLVLDTAAIEDEAVSSSSSSSSSLDSYEYV
jgi:hypothetical protein